MLLWLLWSVDLVSDMRALNFLQQGQKGLTWNFEFLILDVELFTSLRCLYYCRKNSDELFAVLDRRAKESDKIRVTRYEGRVTFFGKVWLRPFGYRGVNSPRGVST